MLTFILLLLFAMIIWGILSFFLDVGCGCLFWIILLGIFIATL